MADPITIMAGTSMALSAGGSVLGAMGASQEAGARAGMYNYQAGVAQINKDIALKNAQYAREVGEVNTERVGMKGRFEEGQTLTKQSGSGFDVLSGSGRRVVESMREVNRQEQGITRAAAEKQAYGEEVKATQEEAQSQLYRMSAREAQRAGRFNVISSLLGGASSVADKFMGGYRAGAFRST